MKRGGRGLLSALYLVLSLLRQDRVILAQDFQD